MLRHCLRKFLRDEHGNVLMLTGLMAILLFAAAGAGVDLGRQQLVRIKLQHASDAAALAAASLEGATDQQRLDVAFRYFRLNYPTSFLGVARPMPTVQVTPDVRVTANADVPTKFMGTMGVQSMVSTGRTVVAQSQETHSSDYDVVLVVDESGSTGATDAGMGGSRMDIEKDALADMMDGIFPPGKESDSKVRLGLVGYTGCISNKYGLTNDKGKALSYITTLAPRAQNFDHYGLQAGLKMLTGQWGGDLHTCMGGFDADNIQQNTDVPSPENPRPDGKQLSSTKYMVFLTDGYIMVEPPPCDQGYYEGCQNYPLFLASCDAAKAQGVIVFTISFVSQSPGDAATLKSCASPDDKGQPRYFYAPDGATLVSILTNIGTTIGRTRITE